MREDQRSWYSVVVGILPDARYSEAIINDLTSSYSFINLTGYKR
jgi:hypothetical protein